MDIRIKCRSDKQNQWELANPILRDKEIVISVENNDLKFKLGDGNRSYNDLPYVDFSQAFREGVCYATIEIPKGFKQRPVILKIDLVANAIY